MKLGGADNFRPCAILSAIAALPRAGTMQASERMRTHGLLIVLAMSSCSADTGEKIVVPDEGAWEVTGLLTSKDGSVMPNHKVEFVRIDRSHEARSFAIVRTDAAGRFYFSSSVSGTYTVISWVPECKVTTKKLGELSRQSVVADLRCGTNIEPFVNLTGID